MNNPLIIARNGVTAVNVNVMLSDAIGTPIVPDMATVVSASFYGEDPVAGGLILDTGLGTSGTLVLANLFATPGFYGAALLVSGASYEHYTMLVTFITSSVTRRILMRMFLSADLQSIFLGSNVTPVSRGSNLLP